MRAESQDQLEFFLECRRRYGDYAKLGVAGSQWHFFAHPDAVEHVLRTKQQNYDRPEAFAENMSSLMGSGLLTSSGELWLRQRRLLQPIFSNQHLADTHRVITRCAAKWLAGWRASGEGEIVDLYAEMDQLANAIAVELLLGGDENEEAGSLRNTLAQTLTSLKQSMHKIRSSPGQPAIAAALLRNKRAFEKLVTHLIQRRQGGRHYGDILSSMMTPFEGQPEPMMSRQQLLDEAKTFLIAGHHATAVAVSWTWYLLGTHEEIRHRFCEGLSTLQGDTATLEEISSLSYARMVLEESLRLYPPIFSIQRTARDEDIICGRAVPAGGIVLLSQWVTHRHPEFWDRPDTFDPDRFAPGKADSRHRFAYFPFGAGQRQCIGQQPAMLESLALATMIGRAFDLELQAEPPVVPHPSFVLMPRDGIRVRVRRRKN